MQKIINFPDDSRSSFLRNGFCGTHGLALSFWSGPKGTLVFESVNAQGGTHTGRLRMPADPAALREVAEFCIKMALIVEEEQNVDAR